MPPNKKELKIILLKRDPIQTMAKFNELISPRSPIVSRFFYSFQDTKKDLAELLTTIICSEFRMKFKDEKDMAEA